MPRSISLEDYENIKALVSSPKATAKQTRSLEKKKLSEERQSRWPNTLEAQRKKKEQAYYERMQREENRRIELDREEDARKAQDRRAKIEYAAQTIYRNTDKAKRLASAELLSDCLYTRGKQLELKKQIEEAEKEWEKQFMEQDQIRLERMKAREVAEDQQRRETAKMIARVQKEQLQEVQERHLQMLREQEEEGQRLLEQAERDAEKEKKRLIEKRELARLNKIGVVKANAELARIKQEFAALDAEEDKKIEAYAKNKEELAARQRKQYEKIEGAKQRRREEMIEQGVRRLREINDSNNTRLENEIAEARRITDERMRKLAEKRAAFEKTINDSRNAQIEVRKRELEAAKQSEMEFAERWRQYNKNIEELEKEEAYAEYQAAKEYQQVLMNQSQERQERELEERRKEIYEARSLKNQEQKDLDEFEAIARQRIEYTKQRGRETYPLRKCLSDIKAGK